MIAVVFALGLVSFSSIDDVREFRPHMNAVADSVERPNVAALLMEKAAIEAKLELLTEEHQKLKEESEESTESIARLELVRAVFFDVAAHAKDQIEKLSLLFSELKKDAEAHGARCYREFDDGPRSDACDILTDEGNEKIKERKRFAGAAKLLLAMASEATDTILKKEASINGEREKNAERMAELTAKMRPLLDREKEIEGIIARANSF